MRVFHNLYLCLLGSKVLSFFLEPPIHSLSYEYLVAVNSKLQLMISVSKTMDTERASKAYMALMKATHISTSPVSFFSFPAKGCKSLTSDHCLKAE